MHFDADRRQDDANEAIYTRDKHVFSRYFQAESLLAPSHQRGVFLRRNGTRRVRRQEARS